MKDGPMHELYEQQRVLPPGSLVWELLQQQMRQLGETISVPPGIGDVT